MLVRHYRNGKKIHLSPVELCHLNSFSCIGCCINLYEKDSVLNEFMRINTERFKSFFPDLKTVNPTFLKEYLRELKKVNPRDFIFLMYNCYFAGFLEKDKVGCLIHPLRLNGVEMRDLVPVNCVPRGKCYRDVLWDKLPPQVREGFILKLRGSSCLEYSREVYNFIPYLYNCHFLKPELTENHYYNIVIKDHGIPVCSKLKVNLELLSEFYSPEKKEKSQEEMLYKYGEPYLEERLKELSKEYNLILRTIKLPEYLVKDGDEYVNGEHIYLLFAPSAERTEKTIIMGTNYNNAKEKLSCNDRKIARTISFLLDSVKNLYNKGKVNYLWVFLGAEKDIILPLRGSYYLMNMLKAGLKIDSITIRPSDILVYIYFQEVLQSKSHYSVDYHIPSPVTYLSDMEEYYKVNFYTHISKPLIELTGPKSISKYFIDSIEDEDFPGLLNIISGTLKKRLTEESPLTLEKLDNICKNLFRDIFGLTPEEEDRYIKELKDCLIEKIYTPACNTDYFRIEEDLLAKGILMKITDRICRFIVTTQSDYTEEFFRILIKYGFLRDSKQYAVSMSFYHMAAGGVPCICVCGSEAKEKTVDKENFHKALFDYLKYMEKERDHKIDRDFIKIID